MSIYPFTQIKHHFTDYEKTHFTIKIEQKDGIKSFNLPDPIPQRVYLDARFQENELILPVLEQLPQSSTLRSLVVRWMDPEFPEPLTRMKNLHHLGIDNWKLLSIPNDLGRLSRLRSLCLDTPFLIGLPSGLAKLKHLRELSFETHYLERLPKNFSQLTNLEFLGIHIFDRLVKKDWGKDYYFPTKWNQSAEEIMELLAQLPNLKKLSLMENMLEKWINRHWIENLESEYSLRKPTFVPLPDNIGKLRDLEELEVLGMKGVPLPPSLSDLKKLKSLSVDPSYYPDLQKRYPSGRVKKLPWGSLFVIH